MNCLVIWFAGVVLIFSIARLFWLREKDLISRRVENPAFMWMHYKRKGSWKDSDGNILLLVIGGVFWPVGIPFAIGVALIYLVVRGFVRRLDWFYKLIK